MDAELQSRRGLETDLRRALANNEFEVHFQPINSAKTRSVRGFEALARWRHPQAGILGPAAFIGPLEACDRIDVFTGVMLSKSARFCREWRAASGLDVTVAVNLSTRSLGDVRFADWVTQLVRDEHLDPQHMVLEVTESATTMEMGHALENLRFIVQLEV